jgi:multidrug efflux pump subunit AcrA (membrane-fusion protein)
MKPIMIDMKDMSESTQVYESRPHPFFVIFIYLILAVLGAAFLWMSLFKIDTVVKATGIVRTEESVQTVTNLAGGKVQEVFVVDGQEVEKGDPLYQIDVTDSLRQLEESELLLFETDSRLEMMEEYRKVIEGETESLSSMKENPYYSEYQNRLELVKISYQSVGLDVNTQKSQYKAALTSYQTSLDYYNNQLQQLDQMKQSINEGVNHFDSVLRVITIYR